MSPSARASDPDTSHLAASLWSSLDVTDLQRRIYDAILEHGEPVTQLEVEGWLAGEYAPSTVRSRMGELRDLGLLIDTGERELLQRAKRATEAVLWRPLRADEPRRPIERLPKTPEAATAPHSAPATPSDIGGLVDLAMAVSDALMAWQAVQGDTATPAAAKLERVGRIMRGLESALR